MEFFKEKKKNPYDDAFETSFHPTIMCVLTGQLIIK